LKAQHFTILTKVVDEITQTHLLQLHNKWSSAQYAFKKVNSFPLFASFFFKFTHKIYNIT
jgi:hypothetical protein